MTVQPHSAMWGAILICFGLASGPTNAGNTRAPKAHPLTSRCQAQPSKCVCAFAHQQKCEDDPSWNKDYNACVENAKKKLRKMKVSGAKMAIVADEFCIANLPKDCGYGCSHWSGEIVLSDRGNAKTLLKKGPWIHWKITSKSPRKTLAKGCRKANEELLKAFPHSQNEICLLDVKPGKKGGGSGLLIWPHAVGRYQVIEERSLPQGKWITWAPNGEKMLERNYEILDDAEEPQSVLRGEFIAYHQGIGEKATVGARTVPGRS